jgi:DNA-binding MarR family transcriptional regulator
MTQASRSGTDAVAEISGQLNDMLRQVKYLHTEAAARVGERVELPAAGVLGVLKDHGEVRMSTLADILRLDLSSVSRQVASLERLGWVGRQRDPQDQRASLLRLTPAGLSIIQQFRLERTTILREVFDDWSPEALAAFADALDRFTTGLAGRQ